MFATIRGNFRVMILLRKLMVCIIQSLRAILWKWHTPMLSTPRALALFSFPFSVLIQVSPGLFHHLSYRIWISPFSCNSRIARDILSRQGEPAKFFGNLERYQNSKQLTRFISIQN